MNKIWRSIGYATGMNLSEISFSTFKEAASYQSSCPLCQTRVVINDRDLALDCVDNSKLLTFYVSQRDDDVITLDTETCDVQLIVRTRPPDILDDPSLFPLKQFTPVPTNYVGRFMHGLTFDCPRCCQYNFTIQIHFDLEHETLVGLYLNSESISIEDSNMLHEVKNIYATKETIYSYFDKEGDSKKASLPLIPLDLSNPMDTIARIRKLLVFS